MDCNSCISVTFQLLYMQTINKKLYTRVLIDLYFYIIFLNLFMNTLSDSHLFNSCAIIIKKKN